ncbi:MAG: hypothetical protein KIT69_11615 [Propionibacteriaceae bacterium]|nr:hypothetical protein [Propionibacteriaceae bacterium]
MSRRSAAVMLLARSPGKARAQSASHAAPKDAASPAGTLAQTLPPNPAPNADEATAPRRSALRRQPRPPFPAARPGRRG